MKLDPLIEANRGKIATAVGAALVAGLPWILMLLVKDGAIRTNVALHAGVFISMCVGALLQWWVR